LQHHKALIINIKELPEKRYSSNSMEIMEGEITKLSLGLTTITILNQRVA